MVHEAYVRLVDVERAQHWDSRGHFYAAAATAMRRILVEAARRKKRAKRGGHLTRVDLDAVVASSSSPDDVLAIDEAMGNLASEDPDAAQLVQLHLFGGLSVEQAAEIIGLSRSSAYEQWAYARAWMRCALQDTADEPKE